MIEYETCMLRLNRSYSGLHFPFHGQIPEMESGKDQKEQ
jgi:hypothetical protein